MTNSSGTIENLTKFQPKWKKGKTQTIRVPIAIAEQLLGLARKLDNGSDSLDTVNNGKLTELYERNGKLTRQCEKLQTESSKLQESLDTAEDTIADLKNEVMVLKADLVKSKSKTDLGIPEAAILLNQLKTKRKKSKTDLQDVQVILEMIEQEI